MKSGIDLAAMDTTVRPQDDLFGHVNGTWAERTEIPGDRGRYGTFDVLREAAESDLRALIEEAAAAEDAGPGTAKRKVGDLFASFMDEGRAERLGVEPVREDLAAVAAVQDTGGLLRLLGRLQREGVDGFVQVFVSTDDRASDRYVVYLEQDGLGLPDESYYREGQYAGTRSAYVRHVASMLKLAGLEDGQGAAERIMAMETKLASVHWDTVATRDAVKSYTKLTRTELSDLTPGIDWTAWLEGLGAPVGAFDEVVGRQPSFLTGLSEALADLPLADWKDWLAWQVVRGYAPYLSADFVEENFDFYGRTLSGTPQLRERWKRGVGLVEEAIGQAAGQLYVERHFPPEAKARMQVLVANLVEAYRRDFQSLGWMGEGTRERALAKLETFRPKIGYPDSWRDYSTLAIEPEDLLGNVRRSSAFETARHLSKIGRPIDRDEWFMTPQTVNAYYNPGMNEIVFPAAILQPPFFDVAADDAVNYGGIGGVIGHEIGHGFDDQGSRYDPQGNLQDWWTADDRSRFDALAHRLIEQFNELEPGNAPGHKINGALTVGENIGDLGGLTIGYKAYQIATEGPDGIDKPVLDGFSGDQRFFMGWAQVWKGKAREQEAIRLLAIDPHAPTEQRANIVRNLHEFYDAFGVAEGDALWLPEDRRVRIF